MKLSNLKIKKFFIIREMELSSAKANKIQKGKIKTPLRKNLFYFKK